MMDASKLRCVPEALPPLLRKSEVLFNYLSILAAVHEKICKSGWAVSVKVHFNMIQRLLSKIQNWCVFRLLLNFLVSYDLFFYL